MRHHKAHAKLGRKRNQRRALLKTLAVSLIMKNKIETTETKAKALRPYAEKLVSYGKKDTVASKRLISSLVGNKATKKLISEIVPKYKDRNGGFIRITKSRTRLSDGSQQSLVEFV